jgi:hypothetical chaperone protein
LLHANVARASCAKLQSVNSAGFGLDFGTTNSSIAVAYPDGRKQLVQFPAGDSFTEAYRSLLYLERIQQGRRSTVKSWTGPQGIEQYLQADEKGRLIQSLKSFLSSRGLRSTEIFGRRVSLEELTAKILRDLRAQAEHQLGVRMQNVVVGRPVRFVGAENESDDAFALARLEEALHLAGFEQVRFELEPMGAACHYQSTLDHDELVLIGDFGGGTSDFSLLRVGPSFRDRAHAPEALLGNEGVGLAGDAFDAKIVRHLVSPALGAGTMIRSMDKLLPVPNWVFFKLERWHHLSLLRSNETLNMLESVRAQALEPGRIEALISLVRHGLGYPLHQAVQKVKCRLSESPQATFRFQEGGLDLEAAVTRNEFEHWIEEELSSIEQCVDRLLSNSGVPARAVDNVFLTGGSSFVPAVRRIFESRFGAGRTRTGDEFTSVASGLALRALPS